MIVSNTNSIFSQYLRSSSSCAFIPLKSQDMFHFSIKPSALIQWCLQP